MPFLDEATSRWSFRRVIGMLMTVQLIAGGLVGVAAQSAAAVPAPVVVDALPQPCVVDTSPALAADDGVVPDEIAAGDSTGDASQASTTSPTPAPPSAQAPSVDASPVAPTDEPRDRPTDGPTTAPSIDARTGVVAEAGDADETTPTPTPTPTPTASALQPSVATDDMTEPSPSASATAEVAPSGLAVACPAPVTDVVAVAGMNEVVLSWSLADGDDEQGIAAATAVYVVTSTAGQPDRIERIDGPVSEATVTGLRNGVEHRFTVYAATEYGRSAGAGPVSATPTTGAEGEVAGLIVQFADGTDVAVGDTKVPGADNVEQVGLEVTGQVTDDAMLVGLSEPVSVDQAQAIAADLAADPAVAWAEPDVLLFTAGDDGAQPVSVPTDGDYAEQWSLWDTYGIGVGDGAASMADAWASGKGAGATVAVIDTGITAHPDLDANVLPGYDFVSNPDALAADRDGSGTPVAFDGDYEDTARFGVLGRDDNPADPGDWRDVAPVRSSSWHGTAVAGIIAAQSNNGGVTGIAPEAKVVPVRALSWRGGLLSDIAASITWASGGVVDGAPANANPANVVNLSFAVQATCPVALQGAIDDARSRGTVLVAAAGNANADATGFAPGNCDGVLTVAATGRDGQRAGYSNYGSRIDLSAPGGSNDGGTVLAPSNTGTRTPVQSAAPQGEAEQSGSEAANGATYRGQIGTSVAAAHVSGAIALMKARNTSLTPDEIERDLTGSVRPFANDTFDPTDPAKTGGTGILALDALAQIAAACDTTTEDAANDARYVSTKVTTPGTCTWSVPSAVTSLARINLVGGGGGGGGDGGAGGGGGGFMGKQTPVPVTPGSALELTVGAGGAAGTWVSGPGGIDAGNGGTTQITVGGTTFTAGGGSGGGSRPTAPATTGGTASGGEYSGTGGAGGKGSQSGGGVGGTGHAGHETVQTAVALLRASDGGGGGVWAWTTGGNLGRIASGGSSAGGGGYSRGCATYAGQDAPGIGGGGGGGVATGNQCVGNVKRPGGKGGNGAAFLRYLKTWYDAATPLTVAAEPGAVLAPAVKVTDYNGTPQAGIAVTFAIASGGGTVGGTSTTTATTDADGMASVSWALPAGTGTRTVTASYANGTYAGGNGALGSPVTFTAAVPTKLGLTTQPSSTAIGGTALATSPVVQLQDASGNAVSLAGVTVTAALTTGAGTVVNGTAVTDSTGEATFSGLAIEAAAGSYTLTFSASPYTSVTSSAITLLKLSQSITFAALGDKVFGAAPFDVSATASSGLPVSVTSTTPSVCTVSGSTVTIVGAGTCSITASQAGNATYEPASDVTRSFTVEKTPQAITFGALADKTYGDGPFVLSATASSGLPVSFASTTTGVCTVSGSVVTIVGAGSCSITASQPGTATIAAATSVTQAFTVNTKAQSITFDPLDDKTYGDAPFDLDAAASSGLPVSFTSTTPSVCTVSGSTVTIVGAGTCSITAVQPGNATIAAATSVTRSFEVERAPQVPLTITSAATGVEGTTIALTSAGGSGASPVVWSLVSPTGAGLCSLSGSTLTLGTTGSLCQVQATRAGDANYLPASSPVQTVTITAPVPTVSAVSPQHGPATGGTSITLTGTGFIAGDTEVNVGGAACTNVQVSASTSLTCTTPVHAAGVVPIEVTTSGGSATLSSAYSYVAAPTITSIAPAYGPTAGGTTTTITGTGFAPALLGGTDVTIDGAPCASLTYVSTTQVLCTTPVHAAGAVDVTVTTDGGTATRTSGFTFVPPPAVTGFTPVRGPDNGGTTLTVNGSGFVAGQTLVSLGGNACTNVVVASNGLSLTCRTPASTLVGGIGNVSVDVTTPGGSLTAAGTFEYVAAPTITSIAPAYGPAASTTDLTITGTGFVSGSTTVTVGGEVCTNVVVADSQTLTCTAPAVADAKAGSVDVVVTTPQGDATKVNGYAYIATPTVSGIAPPAGPVSGGTPITITGTGFITPTVGIAVTGVDVGTTPCGSVVVVNATTITCTTPAETVGPKTVTVTTHGGSATDTFTYMDAPTVGTVTPSTGPIAGGTTLTITGTDFLAGSTTVTVDGQTCTSPVVTGGGTSLTCTTPAHVAGVVDVVVTAPGGAATAASAFEYLEEPTVSAVAPSRGPIGGGTVITVTGTGFTDDGGASVVTEVTAGGVDCPVVSVVSDTELTCTTGSHPAGAVAVAVTTTGGTGSKAHAFTYVAAPTVTAVAPASGPLSGGTSIAVTGTDFVGVTSVKVGGVDCTSFTVNSATSITCTTPGPASAGSVDVSVTAAGGTGAKTGGFTYLAAPTATAVTPVSGPTSGGTQITVTGSGFVPGATTVTVGGLTCASPSVAGDGLSLTCTTPARAAGSADVVVATAGGSTTKTGGFTYLAPPTATAVTPASGPTAGGTDITVTGSGFVAGATTVTVGGVGCAIVGTPTASSLTCTTGAHAAGTVNVVITTAGGAATRTNAFTYLDAPTVGAVAPAAGPTTGGTTITLTGTGFTPGTTVAIDGDACTVLSVAGDGTSLTCVTSAPSSSGGPGNIVVTTPGGSASKPGGFTFVAPPTVTAVSPAAGPTAGGTTITVTGTGFVAGSTTITAGGVSCTIVGAPTAFPVTCTTGAHAAGPVAVVVTTPGGSDTLVNAFTYVPAPTVSAVAPAMGPASGGTSITVSGSGFVAGATTVTVGGAPCTSVAVAAGGGSLTCFTPTGSAGSADVVVSTAGGSATSIGGFAFIGTPTISGVSPQRGPESGGTSITVTGTGFVVGGTTVAVGGVPCANPVVNSSTSLSCSTPGGAAGAVNVAVTTIGGTTTLPNAFAYVAAPTIISISPNEGPAAGGTTFTVTGTGFVPALVGGTAVTVDGVACVSTAYVSPTEVTCTTSAHVAGPADVAVATDGGSATATGGFTFFDPPSAPGTPSAVAGEESAVVTWSPSTGDVTSYTVESVPTGASCTAIAPATTCTVTPLVAGVAYDFVVTAHGPGGSAQSAVSTSPVVPTAPLPAVDWDSKPAANGNAWSGVAYGNATFVAVSNDGSGNQVMTSTDDGATWQAQPTPTPAKAWNAIAFGSDPGGGPLFVAVGDDGAVMTSPDGMAWTPQSTPTSTHDWQSIAYGDDAFVAVADDGSVMRSVDGGVTWVEDPAPTSPTHPWASVTYGDGVFVAVADDGTVMRSTDGGVTWTPQPAPTTPAPSWNSVTYGEDTFVAVGENGAVMTSTDGGQTWTPQSAPGNDWTSITHGGGTFVAVANDGTGDRVMTSEDGITWVPRDSADDADWSSVVFGGGTFVAVASDGAGGTVDQVMVSPDGVRVPGAPGTPSAVPGVGSAVVSWDPPASGGQVTSYTVVSVPTGASCTVAAPATSCTVSPLQPGEDYTFIVVAHGPGGDTTSAMSTTPVTPSAPSGGGIGGGGGGSAGSGAPGDGGGSSTRDDGRPPLPPIAPPLDPIANLPGVVTVDGSPVGTQLTEDPSGAGWKVAAPGLSATITTQDAKGTPAPMGADGSITAPAGGSADIAAGVFVPASPVVVYAIDESGNVVALGTLWADEHGAVAGRLAFPVGMVPGRYVLQLNGYAAAGGVVSLNLRMNVTAPATTASASTYVRSAGFFHGRSDRLTANGIKRIDRLISRIPVGARVTKIDIVGVSLSMPTRPQNRQLAGIRGKTLRAELKRNALTGTYAITKRWVWGKPATADPRNPLRLGVPNASKSGKPLTTVTIVFEREVG